MNREIAKVRYFGKYRRHWIRAAVLGMKGKTGVKTRGLAPGWIRMKTRNLKGNRPTPDQRQTNSNSFVSANVPSCGS